MSTQAALAFTVPGPPQGKGRPRFVRSTGHAFTPSTTRSYESLVTLAAARVMEGRSQFAGPVSVSITAVFAVPASWSAKKRMAALVGTLRPTVKPDTDNLSKVKDALNGVVWLDDKQVVDERILKIYGDAPCMRFVVEEIA